MGRILALDYGKVRTGLAISDVTKTLARALKVVNGLDNLKKEIEILTKTYDIEIIVLGISYKSDGTLGEIGELALEFGKYIISNFPDIKVVYQDEAMTTKAAERYFREMGRPIKKIKKDIDKYAAEIILQNYLSFYRRGSKNED